MKSVYIFIACVFFSYSNAQRLESFGLKGKVKSIQDEFKMCSNKCGKTQTKDCSILTSEKRFTKEGYLSDYKDSLGSGSVTREKVETPNGWLETVYNNEDGLKIKIGEHYYNKEDLMLNSISYQRDTVFNFTKYLYDEMGRKTKKEEIAYIKGVREKTISFFDKYGSFSSFEIYRDDVLSDQGKFDITYEFDEKGNWVQSIVTTEFSTNIHKRTITYY